MKHYRDLLWVPCLALAGLAGCDISFEPADPEGPQPGDSCSEPLVGPVGAAWDYEELSLGPEVGLLLGARVVVTLRRGEDEAPVGFTSSSPDVAPLEVSGYSGLECDYETLRYDAYRIYSLHLEGAQVGDAVIFATGGAQAGFPLPVAVRPGAAWTARTIFTTRPEASPSEPLAFELVSDFEVDCVQVTITDDAGLPLAVGFHDTSATSADPAIAEVFASEGDWVCVQALAAGATTVTLEVPGMVVPLPVVVQPAPDAP